jgi:hypothetical protein
MEEYHTPPHPSHPHTLLSHLHSGPLVFDSVQPPQDSCMFLRDHVPIVYLTPQSSIHTHTLLMTTLFTLTYTQVPRFLSIYLKDPYDFFGGIDVYQ